MFINIAENIAQSMKKVWNCLAQRPSISLFPSKSTRWRVTNPLLHPSVHSTQFLPSFVYLPVSSSRLLAFSSLSSARVVPASRFKWAHEYHDRAYQLLFLRRTTPMNNAFPGEIDMQIAKCTHVRYVDTYNSLHFPVHRLFFRAPFTARIWVSGISLSFLFLPRKRDETSVVWRGREARFRMAVEIESSHCR